jgi:hypothetical protein
MKIIIYIFIFTLYTFTLLPADAQPSITWQRYYVSPLPVYHENFGEDICQADNGNFYVIGSNNQPEKAYIIKINAYGDTIWTRLIDSMGAYTGVSSGDGGCVFTGRQSYPYTIKINALGNIEWYKVYPGQNSGSMFSKIIKTNDGGYIFCGYKGYYLGVIVKVDASGNLMWQREYASAGYKFYESIVEAYGSGYFAVGDIINNIVYTGHGIINKLDTAGNIVWEKEYSIDGIRVYKIVAIDKINGNYIATGSIWDSTSGKQYIGYLKIDSAGNVLARHTYRDSLKKVYSHDIKPINSNKYALISALVNPPNGDTVYSSVYLIDSLGNVLVNRIFDGTNIIAFNRILPLNNGDITFVGSCNYYNPNVENAFVVRADSNLYATPINILNNYNEAPNTYRLYQNFPNPFNPLTNIRFDIRKKAFVKLTIYDILGREVAVLVNQGLKLGTYEVEFDGTNFASGVYFYKLVSGEYSETKKMVLVK